MLFQLPDINEKNLSNWDLQFFNKFEKVSNNGQDFNPVFNELCLFLANNNADIQQTDALNFIKKIEKKYHIPLDRFTVKIEELKQLLNANSQKQEDAKIEENNQQQPIDSKLKKAIEFIHKNFPGIHVNAINQEIMFELENDVVPVDFSEILSLLEYNEIFINNRILARYIYNGKLIPVKNHIEYIFQTKITPWEPTDTDFVELIFSYFKLPEFKVNFDVRQHYKNMFIKALVRCLENAIPLTIKNPNKQILIIKGPQNSRKTSFVRWLFTPFKRYIKQSVSTNPKDEDCKKSLFQNMLIFNDEFDRMTHRELTNFKNIISFDTVKFKLSGQSFEKEYPRRASFFSTTDKPQFLTDLEGNVRVVVMEILNNEENPISEILLNNTELCNLLWSQIYYYFQQSQSGHFNSQLTSEEIKNNAVLNKRYFAYKSLDSALETLYPQPDGGECIYMNASELIQAFKTDCTFPKVFLSGLTNKRIGHILTKLGYEQVPTHLNGQTQHRRYKFKKLK